METTKVSAVQGTSHTAGNPFRNNDFPKYKKSKKEITVIKEGNTYKCNDKVYKKVGSILSCGSSFWVNVDNNDVEKIILRDNV